MKRKDFLKSLLLIPAISINPAMLYQDSDLNKIRKIIEKAGFKIISRKYKTHLNSQVFFEIQDREGDYVCCLEKITLNWLKEYNRQIQLDSDLYDFLLGKIGKIACEAYYKDKNQYNNLVFVLTMITPYIQDFYLDD